MLKNKFNITQVQYLNFDKQITKIKTNLQSGLTGNCPYNPELISKALDDIEKGKFHINNNNKILRLISEIKLIPDNSLKKFIADAKDVFKGGIDSDFSYLHDSTNQLSESTTVNVWEMFNKNSRFAKMMYSLSKDLNKISLSQNEIINFCMYHKGFLSHKLTFFLFKEEHGSYFVANVYSKDEGLYIYPRRIEYKEKWEGSSSNRLVVKKTII